MLTKIANDLEHETDTLVNETSIARVVLDQVLNVPVNGIHTNSFECRRAVIEAHAIMEGKRKINKG